MRSVKTRRRRRIRISLNGPLLVIPWCFMEESPSMTRLAFGTMGFSYSDWAGVFYPSGMKPGDYLSYYARHFDTVELDTTFHATPPPERVRRWADVTPEGVRFCVKVPKDVTHEGAIDRRGGGGEAVLCVVGGVWGGVAGGGVPLAPGGGGGGL